MNVRSLYASAPPRYERSQAKSDGLEPSPARATHLRKVTDEVILSARARGVLDEMRSRPEVATSIQSRIRHEPLTGERELNLSRRIERGYYQEAHVIQTVVDGVTKALTYGP